MKLINNYKVFKHIFVNDIQITLIMNYFSLKKRYLKVLVFLEQMV